MRIETYSLTQQMPADFRRKAIVDFKGNLLGYLSDLYVDSRGNPRYFTLDSEHHPDDNLYPVEFIENIYDGVITLCMDFGEIRGSRFILWKESWNEILIYIANRSQVKSNALG